MQYSGSSDSKVRVSFTVYRNGDLFPVPRLTDDGSVISQFTVNSLVISAAVNGVPINNLTQPVVVKLRLTQVSTTTSSSLHLIIPFHIHELSSVICEC